MQTSQNGITLIKTFEGCKLIAYRCPAGVWTIGVGHTGKVDGKSITLNMKITQEKADAILKSDLKVYEGYVNALKLKLNQNEFDALVSFCFNCGKGNLQTLVKNRTNAQIAEAILKYNKAGGKVLAGLTKRRKAEQELFLKPVIDKIIQTVKPQKEVKTEKQENKEVKKDPNALPYEVKTTCALNIRSAAGTNYPVIRTAKKGEILKVWAVLTNGGEQWGKNGKEFYCLKYCERV